jgi:hypothetical protein
MKSQNPYISCSICSWLIELEDKEMKDRKKYGLEEEWYWCHYDNPPMPTIPMNFCHNFVCYMCNGDAYDGENHAECLDIEFEEE